MTDTPPMQAALEAARTYPLVDARCGHPRCDQPNVYRMVGHCTNCHAGPLLVLISARHETPTSAQCPKCGCHKVRCDRLATDDELPEVAP